MKKMMFVSILATQLLPSGYSATTGIDAAHNAAQPQRSASVPAKPSLDLELRDRRNGVVCGLFEKYSKGSRNFSQHLKNDLFIALDKIALENIPEATWSAMVLDNSDPKQSGDIKQPEQKTLAEALATLDGDAISKKGILLYRVQSAIPAAKK